MAGIGRRWSEDDFGVARDLDHPAHARAVDDARPSELDVVLGRHGDLGMHVEPGITAAEFGAPFREDRLVVLGGLAHGLMRGRPDLAARDIAQIAERAPVVARRVLPPPRQREIVPATAAAARVGHHHVVATVRQELHFGRGRGGAPDDAHRDFRLVDARSDAGELLDVRERRDRLRNALLQQQQRRLEQRIRGEALLHRAVVQQMTERQQAHALVMRHERADDRARLAARQSRRRVVDRLEQAESAREPLGGEALQVEARGFGRDHERQHRTRRAR